MRDTSYIITEFEKFDSVYITAPIDTITIDNETVRTVIYRQHDTLRVVQTIAPDTTYIYRDQIVTKIKTKRDRTPLVVAVLIVILWAILRRITQS